MKNYFKWISIDKKDEVEQQFILKYELTEDDKKIKVFYANGTVRVLEYTEEIKERILLKMKEQISKNMDYLDESFKDEVSLFKSIIMLCCLIMVMGIGIFWIGDEVLVAKIVACFLSGISGVGFIGAGIGFCLQKKYYNDYKKNKMFLENENLFGKRRETPGKTDSLTISHVCEKSNDMSDNLSPQLDINMIDGITLSDMKKLLKQLKSELVGETNSADEGTKNGGYVRKIGKKS